MPKNRDETWACENDTIISEIKTLDNSVRTGKLLKGKKGREAVKISKWGFFNAFSNVLKNRLPVALLFVSKAYTLNARLLIPR